MIKPTLLFFSLVLFLSACTPPASPQAEGKRTNRYYDLKSYFEKEVERLNQVDKKVIKTVRLNEEQERKEDLELDYAKELQIFSESHINKVSWWGKYAGDTSYYSNGQIEQIGYQAKEEDLKTKSINIFFSEVGEIDSLLIINSTNNPTINTFQELTYIPNVKYRILSQEKVALSKDRKVTIEGVFSK